MSTRRCERSKQTGVSPKSHPLFPPGHFTIGVNLILGKPPGPMVPFIVPQRMRAGLHVIYPAERRSGMRSKPKSRAYLNRVFDQIPGSESPPDDGVAAPLAGLRHTGDHPIVGTSSAPTRRRWGSTARSRVSRRSTTRPISNGAASRSISFGPGNVMMAHAVDEYVECDEVINACKVLRGHHDRLVRSGMSGRIRRTEEAARR